MSFQPAAVRLRRLVRTRRTRRWPAAVAVTVACLLLFVLAGCAGSSPSQGGAASSGPVRGGTLNYAITYPIDSLAPAVSDLDDTALIDGNIFDFVVVQTGQDSFGPWLATRWTISPDGKTYTFSLRPGVKFQEGTPFTAAAVQATLNHVVAPATGSKLAASLIAPYARVVRVQTLVVRDSPYVRSATALGIPRRAVIIRHIAPNVVTPLAVLATMTVGVAVIAGSSLSYLGLGAQPPTADWGAMLAQGQDYLQVDWAREVFPALALTLTVIAIGTIGRAWQARAEGRGPR